ncbi:hypothetical protein BRC81_01640 [Halobacteriales archaeon QS_1_68_20]|nr:MAG: hypothetical protein BRC81_01640 [Halobacteriales archaeon QS_1_68_20]
MTRTNVSRRHVLRGIAAGSAATGIASEALARETDRKIVGLKATAGFDVARQKADDVYRELDFGHVGKAVAGKFSDQALQALENNPNVRYVERDGTVQTLAQTLPWGVDRVDADVAHDDGITGSGGDIAIIDTGIDATHTDLEANLGTGKAVVNCSSGCDTNWDDDKGHGTHCAGIADAIDNSTGVVGVSTEATLHAVKVLDQNGYGSWSDVADGIRWVADQGYDVGSMSLGASSGSSTLRDACQYAYDNGVLLVAAAGNSGPCSDCVGYPAAYSTVMAVSATNSDDELANFSSTGPEIEIAAPGKEIYSTYNDGGYTTLKGTSMACPHVSGAGGFLMANGYSNTQARDRLKSTAEDIGLPDNEQGSGLLDAAAAAPSQGIGEVGSVTTDQPDRSTWFSVGFDGSYDDPVVIMKPVSYNGGQPVHVRLRNVTGSGFEFQLEEWNYLNGKHTTETIHYLVVEKGVHTLADGTTIEAGSTQVDEDFNSASFSAPFSSAPVVLAQPQTKNGGDEVVSRQRNVTASGLELQLQEEEARAGYHTYESVGYVAAEAGSGSIDGYGYEFGVFDDVVTDDYWTWEGFANSYNSPTFVADIRTYNGGDTSELRYRKLDSNSAEVYLEEEQSDDDETHHADDRVAYAVFEAGATL